MLKPPDETMRPNGPNDDEQPIDELFGRLIDEGTDYAAAELKLVQAKTMAEIEGRLERYKIPAVLIGSAVLLALAAVVVLAVAGFHALLPFIGPIFAGILTSVIVLGFAGLLVWLAMRKLKEKK